MEVNPKTDIDSHEASRHFLCLNIKKGNWNSPILNRSYNQRVKLHEAVVEKALYVFPYLAFHCSTAPAIHDEWFG